MRIHIEYIGLTHKAIMHMCQIYQDKCIPLVEHLLRPKAINKHILRQHFEEVRSGREGLPVLPRVFRMAKGYANQGRGLHRLSSLAGARGPSD